MVFGDYKLKEAKIEDKVTVYAISKGWLVRKFKAPGRRSVPDRLFLGPGGVIFFIEFKRPKAKATEAQKSEHMKYRTLGHTVYVIDNIGAGYDAVDKETLKL